MIKCQNIVPLLGKGGAEERCPNEATHVVHGLPGTGWSGYHCPQHTKEAVLHYDHQGGCVVRAIPKNCTQREFGELMMGSM